MKTIAITGSTGLVGSRVVELLADTGTKHRALTGQHAFTFLPVYHRDVDITDKDAVESHLSSLEYDILLHMAAYTHVDGAESEEEKARLINVTGTKNLLEATQKKGKGFVYISTDFVFDGSTKEPYTEECEPNPISMYGQTKYEGEQVVEGKGMIVRISYPYGISPAPKKGFVRTIRDLLAQGKELKMVEDSLFSPTFIDDVAYGLGYLLEEYRPEVVHLCGSQSLSPYEAGIRIAQTFNLDPSLISPTTYDEYFVGKAKRPRYSVMMSKKNSFQRMKSFEEGLEAMKVHVDTI